MAERSALTRSAERSSLTIAVPAVRVCVGVCVRMRVRVRVRVRVKSLLVPLVVVVEEEVGCRRTQHAARGVHK